MICSKHLDAIKRDYTIAYCLQEDSRIAGRCSQLVFRSALSARPLMQGLTTSRAILRTSSFGRASTERTREV